MYDEIYEGNGRGARGKESSRGTWRAALPYTPSIHQIVKEI